MTRTLRSIGYAGLMLVLGSVAPASAGVITLTNSTPGLFDASSGTRSVTVTGAELGYDTGIITDVNISINFAKADGESFDPPYPGGTPFHNEIHFHLTGPSATLVHLIEPNSWGAGSVQFDGTITFDDAGALVVNFGPDPVAGTYRPTGPGTLGDYNGELALGAWTLFIQDTVGLDALRFRNFDLEITTEAAPVPEPASLLLLGSGIAGAFARRKRRMAAAK